MKQLVGSETHVAGHTIDLVITRSSDSMVKSVAITDLVSDHYAVHCCLDLRKPKRENKLITYRKSIVSAQLRQDRQMSPLIADPATSLGTLTEQYDVVLGALLNKHAPVRTSQIAVKPVVPWYAEDIANAKQKRRQLERKWRKTRLHIDREIFMAQRDKVRHMLVVAKFQHYNESIINCGSDQRALFKVISQLMHRKVAPALPQHTSLQDLACDFSAFFISKIQMIRDSLQSQQPCDIGTSLTSERCTSRLATLTPVTETEVAKIIRKSAPKTCLLDPLPTQLVTYCEHVPLCCRVP